MKNRSLAVLTGLALCCALSLAQETKPFTTTATESGSECVFTGKSYDDVWAAASNVLMNMKYKIGVAQKDAGILSGEKGNPKSFISGLVTKGKNVNLIFKKLGDGVSVSCNLKPDKGVVSVFEEMGKLLYPK
jgi:hypothetical protein